MSEFGSHVRHGGVDRVVLTTGQEAPVGTSMLARDHATARFLGYMTTHAPGEWKAFWPEWVDEISVSTDGGCTWQGPIPSASHEARQRERVTNALATAASAGQRGRWSKRIGRVSITLHGKS